MTSWKPVADSAHWADSTALLSLDKTALDKGLSVFVPPIATDPVLQVFGVIGRNDSHSTAGPASDVRFCAASAHATLSASVGSNLETEVDWRVERTESDCVRIDVVVSASTQSLDASADVLLRSRAESAEILLLKDAASESGSGWIGLDPGMDVAIQGASCTLVRLPGTGWSYVEMFPPGDSLSHGLRIVHQGDGGEVVACHRLFSCRVEKGVLLRACLRGAILPRQSDCSLAASLFARFAAADPPLGR
ncbi:MAG: hypothetical protein ACYC6Y_18245 [Thermoguttaceae bacterium]